MKKYVKIMGVAAVLAAATCLAACGITADAKTASEPHTVGGEPVGDEVIAYKMGVVELIITSNGDGYDVALKDYNITESGKLAVSEGETLTFDMLFEAYKDYYMFDTGSFIDMIYFTDKECLNRFTGVIDSEMTLYYGKYCIGGFNKVVFSYNEEEYNIYRAYGKELSALDFSRSAYGVGDASDYVFYSDAERTKKLDITNVTVSQKPSDCFVIYVGDAE